MITEDLLEEMIASEAEMERAKLRDQFAMAVAGKVFACWGDCEPKHAAKAASVCYEFADAMLAARGQK